MGEINIEVRLRNTASNTSENISLLLSYMTDDHIVDIEKLQTLENVRQTVDTNNFILACENTKHKTIN